VLLLTLLVTSCQYLTCPQTNFVDRGTAGRRAAAVRVLGALSVRSSTQEVCCWYLGARPSRGARARARARCPPRPVGVRQREQRTENTSLPIYGSVQKYTSDTNHEPRSIFHINDVKPYPYSTNRLTYCTSFPARLGTH
jgi:hypothetical protein